MQQLQRNVILALALALLASPAWTAAIRGGMVQEQAPVPWTWTDVPAPKLRPGLSWRYEVKDGYTRAVLGYATYDVTAAAADAVTVEKNLQELDKPLEAREGNTSRRIIEGPTAVELYTPEWNPLARTVGSVKILQYDASYRAFDFPLSPGKRWGSDGMATDQAGNLFALRLDAEVLGWEKVAVREGSSGYHAIKVRRNIYVDHVLPGHRAQSIIEETDWYSPTLRFVVRREIRTRYASSADSLGAMGTLSAIGSVTGGFLLDRHDWLTYEFFTLPRWSVRRDF